MKKPARAATRTGQGASTAPDQYTTKKGDQHMSTSVSINIGGGADPRFGCHTYGVSKPILFIDTAGSHFTASAARHQDHTVTEGDLAAARALLAAVQTYLGDLVAKHAAQTELVAVAS